MNKLLFAAGVLVSTPALAFPVTLTGEMCEVSTGICGGAIATLNRGGTGSITVDVIGTPYTTPIRWRTNPTAGTVDFMMGTFVLHGTLAGGCGSGTDVIATPAPLTPILGATMTVDWTLCR